MEYININYPNGKITIDLAGFFPTSKANIRKLNRVMEMDWKNQESIRKRIKAWLENEVKDAKMQKVGLAEEYILMHPQVKGAEAKYQSNELYLERIKVWGETDEYKELARQLKEEKRKLAGMKRHEADILRRLNTTEARLKKLQENMGVV